MIDSSPAFLLSSQFECTSNHDHSFQCDCACPDSDFTFGTSFPSSKAILQHPYLHRQPLPDDHTLFFNPYHNNGPIVLNAAAQYIWQRFATPRSKQEVATNADELALIDQLVQVGALTEMGVQPPPRRTPPKVLSAWLHVTNECNLRCDYCYINKSGDEMDEATGRAAVDAIFRSAINHGFQQVRLKFAGGEATLNLKRVFAIHAYAQTQAQQAALSLDTVMLSNGVALGERTISESIKRGIRISISLDGIDAAHDVQRPFVNGAGSFRYVTRTIDRLVARDIKPFISITLSNRNAAGLPDVVRYVIERDLPFNINFFRENDCAAPFADLQLQDDKIIDAMQRAFAVLEADLPRRSLLASLIDRAQFDMPHDKTCSVGESYLVVDHQGNIAKCHMEIEKPITSVYVDDPLTLVRADRNGLQNISVEEKQGCRDCEWKYWCAGGCPLLTYRTTGRYDVKSPNCRIYKAIYPELLRLEGLRLMKMAGLFHFSL